MAGLEERLLPILTDRPEIAQREDAPGPGIGLQLRGGYLGSYFSRPGGGAVSR